MYILLVWVDAIISEAIEQIIVRELKGNFSFKNDTGQGIGTRRWMQRVEFLLSLQVRPLQKQQEQQATTLLAAIFRKYIYMKQKLKLKRVFAF